MGEPPPRTLAEIIAAIEATEADYTSHVNNYVAALSGLDPNDAAQHEQAHIWIIDLFAYIGYYESEHMLAVAEALGLLDVAEELDGKTILRLALQGLDEHMREQGAK